MKKLEYLIASCCQGNGRDARKKPYNETVYCPYVSPDNEYSCPRQGELKVLDVGYGKHEVLREVYLCNWRGKT